MLPLFNSLLAQIIALAFLLVFLAAPFLALWVALSIRRDLGRIADAVDFSAKYPVVAAAMRDQRERELTAERERRASNTVLGQ